jgi:predicted DNA-binding transcriptional regulator AlpA
MTTDDLLSEILAELRRSRQVVGLDAALWDAADVAAYLRVTREYVLQRLAPRADWPKAIRLSDGPKLARWRAREVIAWAQRRQRTPPEPRQIA